MPSRTSPLPASLTKHLSTLSHPLPKDPSTSLQLRQISESSASAGEGTGTTGTTLWLGAQVLGCYLSETLGVGNAEGGGKERNRILELGGGVGYLALVLASLGHEVTTTDIPPSLQSVLQPNIDRNVSSHPGWTGTVHVKELDWFDYVASGDDSARLAADNARRWLRQNVTDTITTIKQTMDTDGFDMIITTDTIYHPSLLVPLLATLRSFSLVSSRPPTVYVALERRDPRLIAHALESAKDAGFEMKRIAQGRVEKCLAKSGWGGWLCDVDVGEGGKKDWEGVEVWKWRFTGA